MESFVYTGAVFGVALGASILPFGRRDAVEKWLTGLLLIIGAVASAAITLQHSLATADSGGRLEILEIGTGFAVGPLLLRFCATRARHAGASTLTGMVHFLPAIVVSVMIAVEGRFVLPIGIMVLHQAAYTTAAIRVSFGRREESDAWSRQLCGVMVLVHCAQVVRMAFSDVAVLRDIVPMTIVGGLCGIAFLALRRALDSSLGRAARGRRSSSLDGGVAAELEARLGDVMSDERPWLDPGLSLDDLAARAGVTPHQLSELLNSKMGTSFNEYVAARRLEEARRRLADPANDRFTIEAIAQASGFSSRSTFYAAFRRTYGTTPTRFRDDARSSCG